MSEKMLITTDQVNPIEIFVNGKYDNILEFIKTESEIEEPTVKNKAGRDLIKSMAARVASSKVFLLAGGKDLADTERKKIADTLEAMNKSRKYIEDCLVYRKAEVRKPLTDYENAKKAEEAAELAKQEKIKQDAIDAEKAEFERQKKELADEKAKLETERLQREADERAKEKAEADQKSAKEEEIRKRIEAEAETERLRQKAIDDENKAKLEKQLAVDNERKLAEAEAKQKEDDRLLKERQEREAQEKRESDTAHRKKINNEALSVIDEILTRAPNPKLTPGQQIIIAISKNEVPNVFIKY
ncbi:MAG: hypothetical protein GWP06_02840 [Actinobacteria bacterium]|nr:hypothetical protein [Actinomycetota bacterium]